MSVSGFSGSFLFAGFLSRKRSVLSATFRDQLSSPHSLVFFESPVRITSCLKVAAEVLGTERRVIVAREISKVFEEIRFETLGALVADYDGRAKKEGRVKGEFTVVIGPSVEGRRRKKKNAGDEEEDDDDDN